MPPVHPRPTKQGAEHVTCMLWQVSSSPRGTPRSARNAETAGTNKNAEALKAETARGMTSMRAQSPRTLRANGGGGAEADGGAYQAPWVHRKSEGRVVEGLLQSDAGDNSDDDDGTVNTPSLTPRSAIDRMSLSMADGEESVAKEEGGGHAAVDRGLLGRAEDRNTPTTAYSKRSATDRIPLMPSQEEQWERMRGAGEAGRYADSQQGRGSGRAADGASGRVTRSPPGPRPYVPRLPLSGSAWEQIQQATQSRERGSIPTGDSGGDKSSRRSRPVNDPANVGDMPSTAAYRPPSDERGWAYRPGAGEVKSASASPRKAPGVSTSSLALLLESRVGGASVNSVGRDRAGGAGSTRSSAPGSAQHAREGSGGVASPRNTPPVPIEISRSVAETRGIWERVSNGVQALLTPRSQVKSERGSEGVSEGGRECESVYERAGVSCPSPSSLSSSLSRPHSNRPCLTANRHASPLTNMHQPTNMCASQPTCVLPTCVLP
jgi:hypothetical protein